MNEIEKISILLTELQRIVAKMDFNTKNKIVLSNKNLKYILFESTHYYNSSNEMEIFEKKFNIKLSAKLKKAVGLFKTKGFAHSDLFNSRISYNPIECFFSLEFVKILINHGISNSDIENGYFDYATQKFDIIEIQEIYNKIPQKENLLIYCIPFAESCGGRGLLILNGDDENIVAYDNHCSDREYIHNGKIYNYTTYLLHEKSETVFEMICNDVIAIKEKLEPYINIY